MKVAVLVSSAIETIYGKAEERGLDTINTINSINANIPNATIYLIDSGIKSPSQDIQNHFSKNVNLYGFWEDDRINQILLESENYVKNVDSLYGLSNKESTLKQLKLCYIKSTTETYIFKNMLELLDFSQYKFIIKISGRYTITPLFNINDWLIPNKYCFEKKIPTNQPLAYQKFYYPTYIFSFCTSLIENSKKVFLEANQLLKSTFNKPGIIDIEHAMYHTLNPNLIHEIDSFSGIGARVAGEKIMLK
jgi:hypothetical protein